MSTKDNVKKFWKTFMKEQKALEAALKAEDKNEVSEIMKQLDQSLIETAGCYLEVNGGDDDFFECTFLPGRDKTSQFICALLKKAAPKSVIDKWIVNECIPPLSDKAFHMNFNVKDLAYGVNDILVKMDVNDEAKTIDLTAYCEAFEWMEEAERETILEAYLENMIGTLQYEARINETFCTAEKDHESEWFELTDLYEKLLDLAESKKWNEIHDVTQIYRVYKRDNEELVDEPGKDKVIITTSHPLLFIESCHDERHTLDQFNRLGGEYATLSYQHGGYDEKAAAMKRMLEKELNDLLYPLGIARTIGGAVGTKYCYIDLAVFDHNEMKMVLEKLNPKLPVELTYNVM